MTEIILRKQGNALIPVDEEGLELFAKLKDGRDVGCNVVQRRNPRHHRLYYAILKFIQQHCELFENKPLNIIAIAVKVACGYFDSFGDMDTDGTVYVPRSIAWAAMDQTEFNEFFQTACDVICKRWMPEGTTTEDVRRELIEMVDGPHALGRENHESRNQAQV